jgi:hypothetical protein
MDSSVSDETGWSDLISSLFQAPPLPIASSSCNAKQKSDDIKLIMKIVKQIIPMVFFMFLPPIQVDIPDCNITYQAFIDYHN